MSTEVKRTASGRLDPSGPTEAGYEALFVESGLCQESAKKAARGLASGIYMTFEDAAFSQVVWAGHLNRGATRERISEVAQGVRDQRRVDEAERRAADAEARLAEVERGRAVSPPLTGSAEVSEATSAAGEDENEDESVELVESLPRTANSWGRPISEVQAAAQTGQARPAAMLKNGEKS